MRSGTTRFITIVLAACFAGALATAVTGQEKPAAAAAKKSTLDNLQAAFDGESNASAKYAAFAKKADEEGYGQVASLFRAASKAEEIHAKNHAEVIRKMGGTPKADVKAPEVKGTKENLEAALKGETYEKDTMYPEFLAQARADSNREAVRTLNFAKVVEAEHAKLYAEVLKDLAKWKGGKKDFFVCQECGNTVTTITFEKCPVCYSPRDKFTKVS
jgi:rubrerythrin